MTQGATDPGELFYGLARGAPRVGVAPEEAALLSALALGKDVLEIGTGLAISTRALAVTAKSVTTIDLDPWVASEIAPGLPPNVTFLTERPALGEWDLIFIDGNHLEPNILADLLYARAHLRPGGLIVMHDTNQSKIATLAGPGAFLLRTTHGLGLLQ